MYQLQPPSQPSPQGGGRAGTIEIINMADQARDRILIADDNEANVELLEAYLADMDVEVAIAVDGQDTLDKAASFQPDLILLDVMMPSPSPERTSRASP